MTVFDTDVVENYVAARDYVGLQQYLIENDDGLPEISPWYLAMVLWVCKLTTVNVVAGAGNVLVVHDVDVSRAKNELYEAISDDDYKDALHYAWVLMPQDGPIAVPGAWSGAALLPQHSPLRVAQHAVDQAASADAASAVVETSPLAAPAAAGALGAAVAPAVNGAAGGGGGGAAAAAASGAASFATVDSGSIATPPAGPWSSRLRSSSKKSPVNIETVKVRTAGVASSSAGARLFQ